MNKGPLKVRTAFISDVHLGTRDCHLALLLDFVRHIECDHLYLLGDIVDLERVRRLFWPPETHEVVCRILDMARRGTRVTYIPGNHDEQLRGYLSINLNGVELAREAVHRTADGKRLLLVHGDMFDGAVKHTGLLQAVGSGAYDMLMVMNRWQNALRRRLGLRQWSLALYLKERLNQSVAYIQSFRQAAVHEARKRGFDGIVCGHIHMADNTEIDGISYVNTGDWVEHCTVVVEHYDGTLHLLKWRADGVSGTNVTRLAPRARAA